MIELAKSLQSKFKTYPVRVNNMFKWMAWAGSFFDVQFSTMFKAWDKKLRFSNTRSQKILGIEYISIDQSVKDMGDTLIETGYIENRRPKL